MICYDFQCYDLVTIFNVTICYDFQCYDFVTIFNVTILLRFSMLRFCYDFQCYDFVTKVDVIFQNVTFFVTKSRRFCYEKSTFSRRFVTISIKHVTKSRRKVDEKSTFCDDCYDIFHQCYLSFLDHSTISPSEYHH